MSRIRIMRFCPLLLAAFVVSCGEDSPSSPTSPPGQPASSPASASNAIARSGQAKATDPSLGAPTPQQPPSGEALKDLQPELTIGNATGGAGTRSYGFDLALDTEFHDIAVSASGVAEGPDGITTWRVTEPLEAETKYYWRARASTSAGPGPYSPTWEFRIREPFINRDGGLVVFDPLTNGHSAGEVMGGLFVDGGWQPQNANDCVRYQVPTLEEGRIEFTTTNLSTPNPVPGKRILLSMWDPTKGDYRENPYRVNLSKLDKSVAKVDDVRLRWISKGEEHNVGISFFDFEPDLVYEWRMEWGTFPGNREQHVKVFLDGIEILSRNYGPVYHPKTHWIELGNCEREETLDLAIFSNVRIGPR